uniref:Uncharacterized protein n=1 Tax=Physcomitrium patens TaxID=3218 RepID=A0A2K1KAM0_PHYPA|nr:hypothetical protein PHYPA_010014 [Physcomitrium patens]
MLVCPPKLVSFSLTMELDDLADLSVPFEMSETWTTHPRSIAERVRGSKFSELKKKLQDSELSLDQQTNTTEMT